MPLPRLYGELAHLWPLVSPPEEYAEEAAHWRRALRARLGPGRHAILELGVGGGHLLSHLAAEFDAAAVDISPAMLAQSQRRNPAVAHHLGDMRSIRLGRQFKAVLIQDAVAYMLTEADLRAAFDTARAHLEPGGVLLAAPDWLKETFTSPQVLSWTKRRDGLELTTIEHISDPDPGDTIIESIFFYIWREGGQTRVEQDRHLQGLFPLATWRRLLEEAGFRAAMQTFPAYEAGYGGRLFVGTLE